MNETKFIIEEWKNIKGYERSYQISNFGRVRSVCRTIERSDKTYQTFKSKILKLWNHTQGYKMAVLAKRGKTKTFTVHRLLAKAFIPNPKNKRCLNHKNGIKSDNLILNLEWCTYSENMLHSIYILKSSLTKKIIQYDLEGNFIKEYFSLSEAARIMNGSVSCICQCLKGKNKTSLGYKWKYVKQKNMKN